MQIDSLYFTGRAAAARLQEYHPVFVASTVIGKTDVRLAEEMACLIDELASFCQSIDDLRWQQ